MRRLALPLTVAALGAGLIALLIFGVTHKAADRSLDSSLAAGAHPPAPASTLPALAGSQALSLASFRGEVVVLNFWASWCEPCQAEAPALERAQAQLRRHDGTVLGVTYQDTVGDARRFVARYALTYPQLRDVSGAYAHSYGTDRLPESFVIDRRGRVVEISRGQIDGAFLARALALAESS